MAEQGADGVERREPGTECFWCGVPLLEDGKCPECGRRQTRVCFCGEELYPGEELCPRCGAGWEGVLKVRRKRRRRTWRVVDLLGYGAAGALLAALLGALVNSLVGGLALRSSEGTELPQSFGERWALAWQTLRDFCGGLGGALSERLGAATPILWAGLVGGMLGVLYYLCREGRYILRRRSSNGGELMGRRRRA